MPKPINGHLLVEPLTHDSFISTQRETYEEIGVVVDSGVTEYQQYHSTTSHFYSEYPKKGDKVLFDAWVAKKFPKEGKDGEFYWFVPYADIVGIIHAGKVSE